MCTNFDAQTPSNDLQTIGDLRLHFLSSFKLSLLSDMIMACQRNDPLKIA